MITDLPLGVPRVSQIMTMLAKTHARFQQLTIVLVMLTFWLMLNTPQTTSISKHPILIVVSFDGFRYDYLQKTSTPNFNSLITSGVQAKWIQPTFVTAFYPSHHSIATGLYEESHGIVGNNFYDPVLKDTFNRGDTRAKWWDTGAIPLYTWNQMNGSGRYSGGMMYPGTDAWIKNQRPHFLKSLNTNIAWKQRVDEVIGWLTDNSTPANCVFMYFEQPDEAGHKYGPDSTQVVAEIKRADDITGYLVSRLKNVGLFNSVNLIITSDHGMSEVSSCNVIDMSKFSDVNTYKIFGGSPVYTILPNPGYEDKVYKSLSEASEDLNFKVYKKDDIPEVYHYRNNTRILPILVVADNHWDIFPNAHKQVNPTIGNHGYNNSKTDMRAFFLAHGPDFKNGHVSEPFMSTDIFPLASCLLGLQPPPNNGSLQNVQALLKNAHKCQEFES